MNERAELLARVAAAERAVVARDLRIERTLHELGRRTQRNAGVALAAGAGVWVLGRLLRRPVRRGARPAKASLLSGALSFLMPALSATHSGAKRAGLPALIVGLLPVLFERSGLFARRAREDADPAIETMSRVDLERFAGRWFEIARLPTGPEKRCESDVAAIYAPTGRPGELAVLNQCLGRHGTPRTAQGVARSVQGDASRLQVSFAPRLLRLFPAAWADYWILSVDAHYQIALTGTPDRRHLWLLSRVPALDDADYRWLVEAAWARGFDTTALRRTAHRLPYEEAA